MTLRSTCRELVLQAVLRRAISASENERDDDLPARLQMVVDEATMKVLTSVVKMGDLHEEGVTGVELLEREREPLPDLDVLYFLTAEASSLERVLADFNKKPTPQHHQVHLAFCKPVAKDVVSRLADSADFAPRVKSFVEVPLSFLTIQDRGFHFDMPQALTGLFPQPCRSLLNETARRLADVCRCVQAFSPVIRYAKNDLCIEVARGVDAELKRSVQGQLAGSVGSAVPCQLLIVDRSIDMAATLVHEFTYECMVYDLLDGARLPQGASLDVDRDVVTRSSKKDMLLNDSDHMWEHLKHLHFLAVKEHIQNKVVDATSQSSGMRDGAPSIEELRDQLSKMPEQKEFLARVDLHLDLFKSVDLRLAEEQITQDLGHLEQDLACGINQEGKDVKIDRLQTQLVRVLSDEKISKESKLRLMMLVFASVTNVAETSFHQQLTKAANLGPDEYVIMNMLKSKLMDVPAAQRKNKDKSGNSMVHRVTKEQAARFKKNAKTDNRFSLSRFEPRAKDILERLAEQRLDTDDYAVLEESSGGGGLRETAGTSATAPAAPAVAAGDEWAFAEAPNPFEDDVPSAENREISRRLILFVVGGITHSELRAAAEVAASLPRDTEVLLGGTSLLTPRRLINALRPSEQVGSSTSDAVDLT